MIKIVCTSCQKPLSLDETKLPMKEVSFPCPVCKTKLSVDRRTLENPAAATPADVRKENRPTSAATEAITPRELPSPYCGTPGTNSTPVVAVGFNTFRQFRA